MPFPKRNLSVVAAAGDTGRATLLLTAAQAVRKCGVGRDVIHLCRRLVVPTAPGLATVDGNDRTLVAAEQNDAVVGRINPDVLIVVAAGRSAKGSPGPAAVGGLPADSARDNDQVRVLRTESRHR